MIDDQPQPIATNLPASWDLVIADIANIMALEIGVDVVIADMHQRDDIGAKRYGVRLTPHNGRDSLVDLYQEVLDAAVYAKNWLMETGNSNEEVKSSYHMLLKTAVTIRRIISSNGSRAVE